MTIKEILKDIKTKEKLLIHYTSNKEFIDLNDTVYYLTIDKILDELSVLYKKRDKIYEK
ncbi:MAG: hypothetical protein H8E55_18885 [Pelagibacterales bacterium]|nr:hypothetical protein [Pelagibacterales bacterium]